MDNYIDIVVSDFDEQPVAVKTYAFTFKVRDQQNNLVINKPIGFKPGATNRLALNILKEDTLYLPAGLYVWGISVINENNREFPLYLELNGDAFGTFNLQNWIGYVGSGYCGSYNPYTSNLGPCVNCSGKMWDGRGPGYMGSGYCGSGYMGSYTGYIGSFTWDPYLNIEPYWNPEWGPQPYWNPNLPAGVYWSPGFCGSSYCSPMWQPIWGPYPATPYTVIYDNAGNVIGYAGSGYPQSVGYSGW